MKKLRPNGLTTSSISSVSMNHQLPSHACGPDQISRKLPRLAPIRLSIAAPAFNEGEGIGDLIVQWHQYLKQQTDIAIFEIIICNDGSTDNTAVVLETLATQYPEIRFIHFKQNQGAAAALAAAISATHFEWVLLMDTDGQFPIHNVLPMIERMRSTDAMAVMGVRNKKDNFFARLGSKASGVICNLVHGSKLKDFNSACKLIDGSLLRSLTLESRGMNYSTEVTSKLLESHHAIVEIDIDHRPRKIGKSNLQWGRDSMHRFLFVVYISLRQLLFKLEILRR